MDCLREHFLGDEVADRLEKALAQLGARLPPIPKFGPRSELWSPGKLQAESSNPILEALREPSTGIEPLLIAAGWNRLSARGVAKIAVRHGRRRADETRRERAVVDAIRTLAKARQRRVMLRCAK